MFSVFEGYRYLVRGLAMVISTSWNWVHLGAVWVGDVSPFGGFKMGAGSAVPWLSWAGSEARLRCMDWDWD